MNGFTTQIACSEKSGALDQIKKILEIAVKRYFERRIKKSFARSGLYSFRMTRVDQIMKVASSFLNPVLTGEAILTIGTTLHEVLDYYDGVISIGPFGCMPSRISEAIIKSALHQVGKANAPFVALEADGNQFTPSIESKLDAFIVQVKKAYRRRTIEKLLKDKPDVILFPEYSIPGFPPHGLLLYSSYIEACQRAVETVAKRFASIKTAVVVGSVEKSESDLYNTMFVVKSGRVVGRLRKKNLRHLFSFRETDYFKPASSDFVSLSPNADVLLTNVLHGKSLFIDHRGNLCALKSFSEDEIVVDTKKGCEHFKRSTSEEKIEQLFRALVTGTRDYVIKNGFEKVILGLSGGIDSSLVAVIAVEALGNNNVVGVLMPSAYTSKESIEDAHKLASNLKIKTLTLPIVKPYEMLNEILVSAFNDSEFGITQENLQARLRGVILMALSNKFGWLVLTTGNKSEIAVGYCTLYGDTAGALAVIGDVFKTDVYRLVRWYNRARSPVIPQRVLSKAPSAELRKGQVDQESLPDYDVLDKILKEILNKKGISEIANLGYPGVVVEDVVKKVLKSEYKRRQLPPQIIVSETPLGHNWSMPIANRCQTL